MKAQLHSDIREVPFIAFVAVLAFLGLLMLALFGCSTPTGTVAPKAVAAQQINFSESGHQDAGILGVGPQPQPEAKP